MVHWSNQSDRELKRCAVRFDYKTGYAINPVKTEVIQTGQTVQPVNHFNSYQTDRLDAWKKFHKKYHILPKHGFKLGTKTCQSLTFTIHPRLLD